MGGTQILEGGSDMQQLGGVPTGGGGGGGGGGDVGAQHICLYNSLTP